MIGIIVASHGQLAEGILDTLGMFMPGEKNLEACVLTPDMGPDDYRDKLVAASKKMDDPEQLVILADLWGGTPFNQASLLLNDHPTWALITGLNLPLLMEAVSDREDCETALKLAAKLIEVGREGINGKPDSIVPAEKAAATAPVATQGAIPPGTVLGDGHIKLAHVRVDTRLLHGQVATAWTKTIQPNRIIVVSYSVSKDELRKTMIVQAAPPGVHVHVVPMSKLIEVSKDVRFGNTKAFLLFETPQEVLEAINDGVDIKKVNLGSMAHSVGKVVCTNAIAMGPEDVKCLEELKAKGVEFDVRKVPTDAPENFEAMLKKAKSELAAQGK